MTKLKNFKELVNVCESLNTSRKKEKKIKIIVHMGTCCIAAGSTEVLENMKKEVGSLSLDGKIDVQPGGCIGLCYAEPTVSVIHPDGRSEVYGTVDIQQGRIIVNRCSKQSPIMGLNELKPVWEAVTVVEEDQR